MPNEGIGGSVPLRAPTVTPFHAWHKIREVSASAAAFAVPVMAPARGFSVDDLLICKV